MTTRLWIFTAMLTIVSAGSLPASDLAPGFDLFSTSPAAASVDLSGLGLGTVALEGVPLDPSATLGLGNTDTLVERLQGISPFTPPAGAGIVDIEVVALHLQSAAPVDLTPLGGPFAGISADLHLTINAGGVIPGLPQPDALAPSIGRMQIRHQAADPGGGTTFDSCFGETADGAACAACATLGVTGGGVFADAIFTTVGGDPANPGDVLLAQPAPRTVKANLGGTWTHLRPSTYQTPALFPAGGFFATEIAAGHCGPQPVAVARLPFACTGEAFIVQNQNAQLTQVEEQPGGSFDFDPIGGAAGIEINNLAFRRTDGLLYGIQLLPPSTAFGGNNGVIQIDSVGSVVNLGIPPGMPSGTGTTVPRFDSGDISPDGSTLYVTVGGPVNDLLYGVDLTQPGLPQRPGFPKPILGDTGIVNDWATHPVTGLLYGGDRDGQGGNAELAILDPATGMRTDTVVPGLPVLVAYGGAWFNAASELFLYRNNPGRIYKIDISGPAIVGTPQNGPSSGFNDSAACVQDFLGTSLELDCLPPIPAAYTLVYTFENLADDSPAEDLTSISAVDDLTEVFGPHGVNWSFTSITSSTGTFHNPSFDGHTDLALIAAGQTLAAQSSVTVTVTVQVLSPDADLDMDGMVCNQFLATGSIASGTAFGDVSTAGSNPDPDGNGSPDERVVSCVNACVPVTLMQFSVE